MADEFAICLYDDGEDALQNLYDDLGLYPPYLPESGYFEPETEYACSGAPIASGWERIVWKFTSLTAVQVAALETYNRQRVIVKALRHGEYVTRDAYLSGWEAAPGASALQTALTLTFTKVRPLT